MNVEIGSEAAQFPEKEYINVIFFAVYSAPFQYFFKKTFSYISFRFLSVTGSNVHFFSSLKL